jgi:hypothetical protein
MQRDLAIFDKHRIDPSSFDGWNVLSIVISPQKVDVREAVAATDEDVHAVAVHAPVGGPLHIVDAAVYLSLELASSGDSPTAINTRLVVESLGKHDRTFVLTASELSAVADDGYLDHVVSLRETHDAFLQGLCPPNLGFAGNECPAARLGSRARMERTG